MAQQEKKSLVKDLIDLGKQKGIKIPASVSRGFGFLQIQQDIDHLSPPAEHYTADWKQKNALL